MKPACLICFLFVACQSSQKPGDGKSASAQQDTIISRLSFINNRHWDSSRSILYRVSIGGDTLFHCTITEAMGGYRPHTVLVNMDGRGNKHLTYRQGMSYLDKVLAAAAGDFNMDSLYGFVLGSLSDYPDLAIAVSREYEQRFGKSEPLPSSLQDFLQHSAIAVDFQKLMTPYGKKPGRISAEKPMLIPKDQLDYSHAETDTAEVPEKVLDCMILSVYVARD